MNAREQILADVQIALHRKADSPIAPIPTSARSVPRTAGDANAEMNMLFEEIDKLGGVTGRVEKRNLETALAKLVGEQGVKKATLWNTEELSALGIAQVLMELGVNLVSPYADKREVAECDLGVTSVDYAFPETGTLMLHSSPNKPRAVSLLPRVHLAIVSPSTLRADPSLAFAEAKGSNYWVFITGPSRTADIELTVTIGVHGPKALYAWTIEG